MNDIIFNAYVDELSKIAGVQKEAIVGFLGRGLKGLGALASIFGRKGGGKFMKRSVGGLYQRAGGGLKGAKAVAKRFAPEATVAGLGGLGLYGAGKAISGD